MTRWHQRWRLRLPTAVAELLGPLTGWVRMLLPARTSTGPARRAQAGPAVLDQHVVQHAVQLQLQTGSAAGRRAEEPEPDPPAIDEPEPTSGEPVADLDRAAVSAAIRARHAQRTSTDRAGATSAGPTPNGMR